MSQRRFIPSHLVVPALLLVAMSAVATLGFRGVFPDWSFVPAALIGAVGGMAMTFIGRWAKLAVTEAIAVSLIAFVLLGAIAASGIPTPGAFGTFFDGLISGWAQVLSSTPPADVTAEFRVLPFTVAWFGAMVGAKCCGPAGPPAWRHSDRSLRLRSPCWSP